MTFGLLRLDKEYRRLEQQFRVLDDDDKYRTLVTANGNEKYPVQSWFHLKEAFSLRLLETLLTDWGIPVESIHRTLDPFCGVGTSLLASQMVAKRHGLSDLEVVGFERNPFLGFVAQTKLGWPRYDPQSVRSAATHLLGGAAKPRAIPFPALSTFHRKDVYDPAVLKQLLSFRAAILSELEGKEHLDLLLLGYTSILEAVSGVRKDGRALRIVPNKRRPIVDVILESTWNKLANDLEAAKQHYQPINAQVRIGDGRTLEADKDLLCELGQFDLIFYSPPYLNNIDYTEVYKLELWMSGFVQTSDEFRGLRFKTLRSHPSVRFRDPITITGDSRLEKVNVALAVLIESLPKDKDLTWRTKLFKGYFDDMYIALKHQIEVLAPEGWIFCVVGNSLHGPKDSPQARVPVAADLLIASIAECLGLEVRAIQVARRLKRRPPYSDYLRESILIMQKPKGWRDGKNS